MRIGDRYVENKLYRGIKHSNNLPLISEDLHEFSDTLAAKSNHLLESILGSGILSESTPTISSSGVSIRNPVVLNIEGDICLISNSSERRLVDSLDLETASGKYTGTIFIVGWYQNITANDQIKEYGGRMNETLPNDLLYEPLDIQVSSRYQFVWDTAIYKGELPEGNNFTINLTERDEAGAHVNTSYPIKPTEKVGSIYKANPPAEMSYAVDELYLIPLFKYIYDNSSKTIESINSYPIRRTSSSMTLIESEDEPVGIFNTGTVWYNPSTRGFKTYIEGTGFVDNAPKLGYTQYQYVNIASTDSMRAMDLQYDIDLPELLADDIFHVTYEGLDLLEGTDYTINIPNKTITLLNFTRVKGEKLVLTVRRLVEVNDVTNITKMFTSHLSKSSTVSEIGHVRLSDSTDSSSGVNEGIAATPKAVMDSKLLVDDQTGDTHQIVVSGNILYIENKKTGIRKSIMSLI